MKLPKILARKTLADVDTDVAMQLASRSTTEAEIAALDAARPAMILEAEPEAILTHDAKRARLAVVLEQTDARLARHEVEREEAEAEAEKKRRADAYAAAKRRRADGVAALEVYERAAKEAAGALVKLGEVEAAISAANLELPAGAEPIPMAEPDNSTPYRPPVFGEARAAEINRGVTIRAGAVAPMLQPAVDARAHVSIRHRARIPGVKSGPMLYDGTFVA